MNELKETVYEQLQQLQMLMHRTGFHHLGKMHNPHRGQGRILAILKLKPEISQKELTYLLNMSKQSAAELISKLEKSGYITREPAESDKRVLMIRLTDEGAKAADDVDSTPPETTELLSCLSDDELQAFSEYLGRIIQQYEQQFPDEDFERRRRKMEDFMSSYGRTFEHGRGPGFAHGRHPGQGCRGRGHGEHARDGRGCRPADMAYPPSMHGEQAHDEDDE